MDELGRQIRSQIIRYLSGSLDARALYNWLFEASWEIERTAPAQVAELARSAQLALDEYAAEGWSEDGLRSRLTQLLTSYTVRSGATQASTVATTLTLQVTVPAPEPVPA